MLSQVSEVSSRLSNSDSVSNDEQSPHGTLVMQINNMTKDNKQLISNNK